MLDCIETPYARTNDGYGRCNVRRFGKRINRAHVLAWIDANGRLPGEGMYICHSCDNPPCVNPEHLWEGTPQDNTLDSSAKGRTRGQKVTHCPQGHEYTEENTVRVSGRRWCRACRLEQWRAYGQSEKGRAASARAEERRPPEQMERRRAYWREYQRRKRTGVAG